MAALQIARPPLQTGRQAVQYPSKISIDVQALFQILSHSLRRKPNQPRIIGTLVGTRSDDGHEVEVKTAYIVPVGESEDEVNIDIEYHKEMFQMMRRVYPDAVILGWYSTSVKLDNLSALIHDFYSQAHGSFPHPAIHLAVPTTAVEDLTVHTYISTPIRLPTDISPGNCIFLPVLNNVLYTDVDETAMEVVGKATTSRSLRSAEVLSDIKNLDKTLAELLDMLDNVHSYVRGVLQGKSEASVAVGKYLHRTLNFVPALSHLTIDELYSTYFQDVLAVIHLTNAVSEQLELTSTVMSKV